MAAVSCLKSGEGEGSTKWFPAFEAILEIRYHFTTTDNKSEPIIILCIRLGTSFSCFPMYSLRNLSSGKHLVFPVVLDLTNRKSGN